MNHATPAALVIGLAALLGAWCPGAADATEWKDMPDGSLLLYDFEGGDETDGWGTSGIEESSVSDQHATSGKHSLKIVLRKGGYFPGFSPEMPRDWSGYDSLRYDIWCETDMVLFFRVDDESSKGYDTRYNLDARPLHAGANTVIIPVADVAARVDVRKIRFHSLFAPGEKMDRNYTFYVDNIRLMKEDAFDPPGLAGAMKTRELPWSREGRDGVRTLYDFEKPEQIAGWLLRKGADVSLSDQHPATGKQSLKVTFKPDAAAVPQVDPVTPEDWSEHRQLELDVWSEEPTNLTVRITDPDSGAEKRTYYEERFQLPRGPGAISIDLEGVGARIDLTRVKQLSIQCRKLTKNATVYIDDVRLVQ